MVTVSQKQNRIYKVPTINFIWGSGWAKEIYRANFIYYGLIQYYNLIEELKNEYHL